MKKIILICLSLMLLIGCGSSEDGGVTITPTPIDNGPTIAEKGLKYFRSKAKGSMIYDINGNLIYELSFYASGRIKQCKYYFDSGLLYRDAQYGDFDTFGAHGYEFGFTYGQMGATKLVEYDSATTKVTDLVFIYKNNIVSYDADVFAGIRFIYEFNYIIDNGKILEAKVYVISPNGEKAQYFTEKYIY